MNRKLLAICFLVVIIAAINPVFHNSAVGEETGETSYAEKALQYISQQKGIPSESLMLMNKGYANYTLTNRQIWWCTILDTRSYSIFTVYIDEAGDVIDIKAIREEENLEYYSRYGKLEKALFDQLLSMGSEERVRVGLWLEADYTDIDMSENWGGPQHKAMLLDANRLAEEPIIEFIETRGFEVIYASKYAPLVFAELSKEETLAIQNRTDIDFIYMSRNYRFAIDCAAQTERADEVWSYGINGSGVKVAVVEFPMWVFVEGEWMLWGNAIEFANPYLTNGSYFNETDPLMGWHATRIAGIIASTHTTYRGIAHGAPGLLSANADSDSDVDIIEATEWAIDQGAKVISNSWIDETGDPDMKAMDKYHDHVVRYNRITVVNAAGNDGPNGYVRSPALAYNVITVGAIDDNDTPDWSDDIMADYSSGRESSEHGDREKPEVVAVGGGESNSPMWSTIRFSPWVYQHANTFGTSFATPSVAGEAALLMQANDTMLGWPEVTKAVIMATAWNNIEGASALSEYDGAGAIDIFRAYDTVENSRFRTKAAYASSIAGNYTIDANAGDTVRAVISWSAVTQNAHPPAWEFLNSNLDLLIFDESDNLVAASCSLDNNYETVEFYAPNDGTYTASVVSTSYNNSMYTELLGFAWDAVMKPNWSFEDRGSPWTSDDPCPPWKTNRLYDDRYLKTDVDSDGDVDIGDQRKQQLAMMTQYPNLVYMQYNTYPYFADIDRDLDVDVGDQRKVQLDWGESNMSHDGYCSWDTGDEGGAFNMSLELDSENFQELAGDQVLFSFWFCPKDTALEARAKIYYTNSSGDYMVTGDWVEASAEVWTNANVTATLPANVSAVKVIIEGESGFEAWVDDAKLYAVQ